MKVFSAPIRNGSMWLPVFQSPKTNSVIDPIIHIAAFFLISWPEYYFRYFPKNTLPSILHSRPEVETNTDFSWVFNCIQIIPENTLLIILHSKPEWKRPEILIEFKRLFLRKIKTCFGRLRLFQTVKTFSKC